MEGLSKLYVAGKWEERNLCNIIMANLEKHGFKITHNWTVQSSQDTAKFPKFAQEAIEGVANADALVFIAVNKLQYQGSFVEMGIALGLSKSVYIVGSGTEPCIFTYHSLVHCVPTIADLLSALHGADYADEEVLNE